MTIIAIDYSYTSPSMCISNGDVYENNQWYYLTDVKKRIVNDR